jgi:hypothetical protein
VPNKSRNCSSFLGARRGSHRIDGSGHGSKNRPTAVIYPVVIRKAGLNGPPGLGEVRARSIPTLEHLPAPADTRPAFPFLVRARSAYPWTAFGKLLQQARTPSFLWRYCIGWLGACQQSRPALLT